MAKDSIPLSAAVLAGGQSTRMGADKALLPLVAGEPPLLGIVLNRLSAIADDVIIVSREDRGYDRFGARVVPDLLPGGGALVGIHAALSYANHDHCLVVACDMPFLSPALLARMAREPRDYDVLVPQLRGQSRQGESGLVYQTLHAIYGKGALPAIAARLAEGKRQVVSFFSDVRLRTLDQWEIERWDPDLRSFFNANTPELLTLARSIVAGQEPETAVGRLTGSTESVEASDHQRS